MMNIHYLQKHSIWVLYLVSFFTMCLGVPTVMTAVSLFALCLVVIVHVLGRERKGLWYFNVIVEGLLFAYSYLNMFDLFTKYIYPESFFSSLHITKVEAGLFVSSNIVDSVSHGEIFFFLLPSFIRIVIAVSRILYLNVDCLYDHLSHRRNPSKKKRRRRSLLRIIILSVPY